MLNEKWLKVMESKRYDIKFKKKECDVKRCYSQMAQKTEIYKTNRIGIMLFYTVISEV